MHLKPQKRKIRHCQLEHTPFLALAANIPRSSSSQETHQLRQQYNELYSQFTGSQPPTSTTKQPNNAELAGDFEDAQTQRPTASKRANSSSKFVRFSDNPTDTSAEEEANRAALLPYRDDPEDAPDQSHLDNQQIHTYHSQVIRDQDQQLDRLGESIGRQRVLGVQIGNELDEQAELIDELDEGVMRHQTQIDKARGRLGTIMRKAKDNMQLTIIFILIIILVLLIIILN